MSRNLLPYGNVRYSDIVAKNGAHSGGGGKSLRSREVGGRVVRKILRNGAAIIAE
jgi:hypothetical protein